MPITLAQRADVKSVRIIHCFVLLMAASQIWGCASASVGFQTNGTYVLERNEQSADCQALHKNISGRIQVLKGIPAKARAEQQTDAVHGLVALRPLVRRSEQRAGCCRGI